VKHIAPQFELPGGAEAFNLSGEILIEHPDMFKSAPQREDKTLDMFDPESDLRAIWTRQGVPADRQNAMLADTSEKATPEFMAQFFPVKN
jgi:hypothetical protein